MKAAQKVRVLRVSQFLDNAVPYIIIAAIVFFGLLSLGNQKDNQQILEQTNAVTKATNDIVDGQTTILNAIERVARDSKLTTETQTKTIICMLQVPVEQRTTDFETRCRKNAMTNDTTNASSSEPSSSPRPTRQTNPQSASPQGNNTPPPQSEIPQPDNEGVIIDLPILPPINIGSPF